MERARESQGARYIYSGSPECCFNDRRSVDTNYWDVLLDPRDLLDFISSRLFASISSGVAVWGLVPASDMLDEMRTTVKEKPHDKEKGE
ncbi:hypothetical protein BPOR_0221g00080 [Botrytis porri]|uniref:Uncharacterized protein n=1 Tax=Botrytis porri TaxID=87229 RepID=A0A4Z1KNB9_9HELO|nr:hypothetical protein BPOR_0221g00080 [Botrytis porri]